MQANFFIQSLAAWEILERMARVLEEGCADRQVSTVSISTQLGGESLQLNCLGKEVSSKQDWQTKVQHFKTHQSLEATAIHVDLRTGWYVRYRIEGNPPLPLIRIDVDDSHRDQPTELRIVDAIGRAFSVIPQTQIGAHSLGESQLAGLRFAERTIASFATEAARLSQSTTKNFEDFVSGVKQRSLELEDQFQKKATELENLFHEKQVALETEHTDKLKDLAEREKSHAESVKLFELRNNTAVRRDLLKEIRTKIEEQKTIVISPATVHKRRIIHIVCIVTMVAALTLVGVYATKLFKETAFDWKLLVPLSTWTALFVMTGVYYIRWNDQWFREHARVEFENRKFSADILRASWVAELFFEWADKKGISMPPELVASFTKNLFDSANLDGKLHPTDQVGELIKQFSTLELNKGGFKVTRKEEAKA